MGQTETLPDQRALLVRLIDEAYDQATWHGPNLKSATRRVSPQQAVWRPRRGGRSIAEIVVHCAYWKYAVRRRIRGDKRGSFPLKGSNWFVLPRQLTSGQWRDYLTLLDDQHKLLRETTATAPLSRLVAQGNKRRLAGHAYGVALHDIYHAGQIRTLKGLYKRATGQR